MRLQNDLNSEQIAAVMHGEGPQLVLAGAGSGKTRVITYRLAWLAREGRAAPGELAAVTFTNKAAGEMRERAAALMGGGPLEAFVGTFHRFALRLLRRWGDRVDLQPDFAILDTADQLALVKQALEEEGLAESAFPPRRMLAAISAAKNRLESAERFEVRAEGFFDNRAARIYTRYQGLLRTASAVDFDDMIALAVRLVREDREVRERVRRRTRYLMVDEYQDTNHAQLCLIREWVGATGNLTAVGDEDQGIYRWRGADLDNILEFERSFPRAVVRKLERNYRSTQTILDASGALVSKNRRRRGKRLWTDAGAGRKISLFRARDEGDEARWIGEVVEEASTSRRLGEIAVLVRTNAQTRPIEEELLRRRIPYVLVGGLRFYERAEIKDLIAYLRVLRNPRDPLSLGRILNQPPRGIGGATRELVERRAAELGQPLWDVLETEALDGIPARGARALLGFRDLVRELREVSREVGLGELLQQLLDGTDYLELFRRDDPEDAARLENIRELLSAAQELEERAAASGEGDALTAFLDHVALVTDIDAWEGEGTVSVMTLHSAKGLEFPLVIIAGLEEGLLPHFNAQESEEETEEERRLLYVGMTRAREELHLVACRRRRVAGRYQDQEESRFLAEIPEEHLEVTESPHLFDDARTRGVREFFGKVRDEGAWEGADEAGPARRGARVRHPTLGSGVILDAEGEGDDLKLTVYFERAGKRKLVAKHASLELLG